MNRYRFLIENCFLQLLTGYTELELPETRKRIQNSDFVNAYPFIFEKYAQHGYATAFNEDLPDVGTFSYRLNGFREQPTNHYMRPFYLAFNNEMKHHKKLCVGDIPRHVVMFDYTKKVKSLFHAFRFKRILEVKIISLSLAFSSWITIEISGPSLRSVFMESCHTIQSIWLGSLIMT